MVPAPAPILRHIRALACASTFVDRTDHELLRDFAAARDEAAFATLVRRHGPLVFSVCRHVLHHEQDAEDAFQATFLVLARKAVAIHKKEAVGGWLHGVAYRTAMNARRAMTRRRNRDQRAEGRTPEGPVAEASLHELQALLDAEVERLPDNYRAPFVLCCLEGRSKAEAAHELGWNEGTVSSRLARARERLRQRLDQHGVTLSAALTAGALVGDATAAVPAMLTVATVHDVLTAGALPAQATAWAEGVLSAMGTVKWKAGAVLALTLSILAAGAFGYRQWASGEPQEERTKAADAKPAAEDRQPKTDRYGDPLPLGAVARLGTVRWRHDGWVGSVAFAPDGRAVASAAGPFLGKTIYIWDAVTGRELRQLSGHEDHVSCVAYSPDGKTLASGSADNTIRLWDPLNGKELRQLTGHQGRSRRDAGGVNKVLFPSNGATLISSGGDKTIRLWDVATGRELRQFQGHKTQARSLALSPDGTILAAVSGESGKPGEIRLWESATGNDLRQIQPSDEQGNIAFSPDSKTLASTGGAWGKPGVIHLWNVATGKEIRPFRGHQSWIYSVAFSADGNPLVSTSYDKTIRLWDVATGKELRQVGDHPGLLPNVAFCPDGKTLVSWGFRNAFQFWDLATGKELRRFEGHQNGVTEVAFSQDGKQLATGAADTVCLWDLTTKKGARRLEGQLGYAGKVVFSPDGKTFAAASSDGTLRLWEAATGQELPPPKQAGQVSQMAFSADGTTLAVCDHKIDLAAGVKVPEDTLRLWDTTTGKELWQIPSSPKYIQSLAFSPDGKLLAAGGGTDLFVHVWDVATGKELRPLGEHKGGVTWVAFSPDGKTLAGADLGHFVHLWEVATGQERLEIQHPGNVTSVVFSPDGRILASGNNGRRRSLGPDGKELDTGNVHKDKVYLWDVSTGREIHRFAGHRGGVEALAFSPDATMLASGSEDTTALLWEVTGAIKQARPRTAHLEPQELASLWTDLATGDGAKVHRAIWTLAAAPGQSLPLVKERLGPVIAADAVRLVRLIADLDSDDFAVRGQAFKDLEKLGESAEPALRKALEGKPSVEVRRRLKQLLEKDRLLESRALEVLEHAGTREARQILQDLVKGVPEARRTREAKAALERLAKR